VIFRSKIRMTPYIKNGLNTYRLIPNPAQDFHKSRSKEIQEIKLQS